MQIAARVAMTQFPAYAQVGMAPVLTREKGKCEWQPTAHHLRA